MSDRTSIKIDWAQHSGRSCGQCSLCCKLLHVIELQKPAGKWCSHCKPGRGGCSIYEARPQICRGYFCGWMLSPNVGEEWYPLKSHMVLSLSKLDGINVVTVTVDERFATAWREPLYHSQLRNMATRGLRVINRDDITLVQVRVGNRVWLVLPTKNIEITHCSYVLKLNGPGNWDVEQFGDSADAEARVVELTAQSPDRDRALS